MTTKVLASRHVHPVADISGLGTAAEADEADLLARANHTGTQSADTVVDGTTNHVFTAADDTKLTGVATGATANDTDANLKNRANHTGTQLAATISDFDTQVRTSRIDQFGLPIGTLSANGNLFSSLADPVSPQDAATKNYTDMAIQGLTPKPTATVVAVAALPAGTYSNGTSGVGATFTVTATGTTTVDGHVLVAGERVLVTAQASGFQNGLYSVTTAGAVGIATVLTRHTSMDTSTEIPGAFIPVSNIGTAHPNSLWLANPSGTVTMGTTAIPFQEINRAADLSQGTGITISGNTVSIENGGVLLPAHGGTGVASLTGLAKGNGTSAFTAATAGTDYYNPGGTDVALADGGTGASLADPNVDRIMFWDDSAGVITWLAPGTGLSITGTSLDASAVTAAFKAVRLNDTGNETYTIVAGTVTQIAGTTIDGVAPAFGDRILISCAPAATGTGSFASNQPANGIYTVTGNTTNITLARASDMSGSETPVGTMVYVRDGNGSGGWLVSCSSPVAGAFTWGTTASQWGYNYATFGYIRNGTFTMANKTLTSPIISTISNTGTLTLPTSTDTLVGRATADTLTSKRITPRVVSPTIAGTYTVDWTNCDQYVINGQTAAITNLTATGTALDGQKLILRIKDNGTARAITWDSAKWVSSGAATLLATTVVSKTHFVGFIYDGVLGKMVCVACDSAGY